MRATPGFHIYLKRPIPHSFKNIGGKSGKVVVVLAPAGIERLFEEIGIPVTDMSSFPAPSTPPDLVRVGEILTKYGVRMV